MYLSPEIVMATMKYVASSAAAGGGIVFDYITPFSELGFFRRLRLRLISYVLAAIGEPWRASFDPHVLAQELKTIGFTHIVDMGPEDVNTRYFQMRMDTLGVGGPVHLMSARR
jgi:O-methyltransferase involved in polyketide biosynthesis